LWDELGAKTCMLESILLIWSSREDNCHDTTKPAGCFSSNVRTSYISALQILRPVHTGSDTEAISHMRLWSMCSACMWCIATSLVSSVVPATQNLNVQADHFSVWLDWLPYSITVICAQQY
jgi:hypothetical protein